MSEAILSFKRGLLEVLRAGQRLLSWRLLLPLGLLALAWFNPVAGHLIVATISEAYLQVSVFVAATLALIYGLERLFKVDSAQLLSRYPKAQVPVAAFLGALPGCGGAIVVVTQYVNGHVRFGALVAVLTATMGDAAFLLLAQAPLEGGLVFVLGAVVGTLSGYVVDALHGPGFMDQSQAQDGERAKSRAVIADGQRSRQASGLHPLWVALMLPGVIFAIPIAMQVDPNTWFGSYASAAPVTLLGFLGGGLSLLMWSLHLSSDPGHSYAVANPSDRISGKPVLSSRVINDTNFVTVWVIAAFLVFELGVHFTGAELQGWFETWAPLTPLIAILVGFLPGCGPQIIVTSLYLTGAIPMAALLGNAISNDGDALFPAIALAPKAAVIATIYTSIPAFIVGYGTYFLLP